MINRERDFLPFSQPVIDREEIEEVVDTLRSGWITTGPKVKRFEHEFAGFVGSKYALAVNSCTAALHLALEAVGVREGDEVITSPFTFASTAEVILYLRAKPVFVDIEPDTLNIDPEKIKKAITTHTRVIIPVHYGGHPCDMDRIIQIAKKHNLRVVEDAAHIFPARDKGKTIGTIGDITCFSFYPTKPITTGEGGMVATDNEVWATIMRIKSLHGISKDAWNRYTSEGSWYYEIIAPGYKYNLTDIAAALGIAQLKKVNAFWKRRKEIASQYTEVFRESEFVETPTVKRDTEPSWHLYPLRLNLNRLRINRTRFIEELKNRGIGTSVHFIPLHIHPYYRRTYGYKPEDFPVAYQNYLRLISLPLYPRMTDKDVERVITAVQEVTERFKR